MKTFSSLPVNPFPVILANVSSNQVLLGDAGGSVSGLLLTLGHFISVASQ